MQLDPTDPATHRAAGGAGHGAQTPADYGQLVLDSADQGVWDYDNSTGQKLHLGAWFRIRGYSPETWHELSDEDWLLRVHPDDRALAREMTDALNSGALASVAYEYRERHRNGHWIWIMCRGRAVAWDQQGRPCRFLGTDTDITPLKSAESQARKAQRRLELALDVANVGVWEYSPATDVLTWDARLRAIYGLPPDQTQVPRDIWERSLHPDDAEQVLALTKAQEQTRDDYEVDYRILRADGQVRDIRSRVSFHDDPVEGPRLMGVNWDVTELRERRRALEAANYLAMARNSELELARAELEFLSMHDPITGLPNRRWLDMQGNMPTHQANPLRARAALHVDIDHFKEINDTLGHAMGDFALRRVAQLLRDCTGRLGTVVRTGGDEFVILIEDAQDTQAVERLAQSVIAAVDRPIQHEGVECRFSVSIGIAMDDDNTLEDLLIRADIALYRAKKDGRRRACLFREAFRAEVISWRKKRENLQEAFRQGQIICHYQPQYDAHTLRLAGVETLVRWLHPTRGLISPAEFLPVAEDMGLLARIDERVMRLAVRDAARLAAMGLALPRLSVNISQHRLREDKLRADLEEIGDFPCPFGFELLESSSLDHSDEASARNIDFLRARGHWIEVDDFGSGHASVVGLMRLKPDRIKIDQALILPLRHSESHRTVVRGVIEIGKCQGARVLAEGIEDLSQLQMLRDIGCDEVQGYGLARPMCFDELVDVLRADRGP